MPHLPSLPEGANLGQAAALNPALFAALGEVSEQAMRGPSPFSPGERELIAAYVSALNGCAYCVGGHRATAEAFGIDASTLEALVADLDSAPVADRLKPVFRLARKLTETPSRVVAGDTEAVIAAGWGEDGARDAILVAALFAMLNRVVDGFGIEHDPQGARDRARRFHDHGYRPGTPDGEEPGQ
ncbi:MAG: peroxidase-related enzyme [Proteobacteria bacterium]|nr:peroxidase-related enzyme [Pseudomonadota bacterium]